VIKISLALYDMGTDYTDAPPPPPLLLISLLIEAFIDLNIIITYFLVIVGIE